MEGLIAIANLDFGPSSLFIELEFSKVIANFPRPGADNLQVFRMQGLGMNSIVFTLQGLFRKGEAKV
jgi:hypothetical protein